MRALLIPGLLLALSGVACTGMGDPTLYAHEQLDRYRADFLRQKRRVEREHKIRFATADVHRLQEAMPTAYEFSADKRGWQLYRIVPSKPGSLGFGDAIVCRGDGKYPEQGYGGVRVRVEDGLAYYWE